MSPRSISLMLRRHLLRLPLTLSASVAAVPLPLAYQKADPIMRAPSSLFASLLLAAAIPAYAQDPNYVPAEAQRQVVKYISQLSNLHCKAAVTQQKLSPSGHVLTTEHSSYD